MTATITDLQQWRRAHAFAHCDAISVCETAAHQAVAGLGYMGMSPLLVRVTSRNIRWAAATARDAMRFWWGV